MTNLERKVEEILSRRQFSSASARDKVKAALLKTLAPVEAIKSFDEDDAYENTPAEIRYDESDGVPLTTIEELENAQQTKKDTLRAQSKVIFSDDERQDDGAGGVAVATDINRKLKWGYTLLHFAALAGDEAECMRLIEAGADRTALDNGQKMPWQKAELKGFNDLALKLMPQD